MFSIRFAQKYDFEAVKLIVKDLNEKENTKREAEEKAKKARKRTHSLIRDYHCSFCGLFHIGHVGRKY